MIFLKTKKLKWLKIMPCIFSLILNFALMLLFHRNSVYCTSLRFRFTKPGDGFIYSHDKYENNSLNASSSETTFKYQFSLNQNTESVSLEVGVGPYFTNQIIPQAILHSEFKFFNLSNEKLNLLQVTPFLITKEISQDDPLLKALFYIRLPYKFMRNSWLLLDDVKLCVRLLAELDYSNSNSHCCVSQEGGICLSDIITPSEWWNQELQKDVWNPKQPYPLIKVSYSVILMKNNENLLIRSTVALDNVKLIPWKFKISELKKNSIVTILIPETSLYPQGITYIPIIFNCLMQTTIRAFRIRVKVKYGIQIIGFNVNNIEGWNVSANIDPGHTFIIIRVKNQKHSLCYAQNLAVLLVKAQKVIKGIQKARLKWAIQVNYIDKQKNQNFYFFSKLSLQKDSVLAVIPLSKTLHLMNIATLTGNQVSESLVIMVVSHSGEIADVTQQCTCSSVDDNLIKVSPSCSSVYLDGSEITGSQNATVLINYGGFEGQIQFTVWMPELPLKLQVNDKHLGEIWPQTEYGFPAKKRQCHAKYQLTEILVLARFKAVNQNSAREIYFLNRNKWFDITELVLPIMHTDNSRIINLEGNIIRGLEPGIAKIQITSLFTHKILAETEIYVGQEKVTVNSLDAHIISGLHLYVSADFERQNLYKAIVTVMHNLKHRYQEGILNIHIRFSDGTSVALDKLHTTEYLLNVSNINTFIVVLKPSDKQFHPRILALNSGSGKIKITLLSNCSKDKLQILAVTNLSLLINLQDESLSPSDKEFLNEKSFKSTKQISDPLYSENNTQKTEQLKLQEIALKDFPANQFSYQEVNKESLQVQDELSVSLEAGLYSLLAFFCIAMLIFIVSCTLYASQFHSSPYETKICKFKEKSRTKNAQDWVWLSKQSLELTPFEIIETKDKPNNSFISSLENDSKISSYLRKPPINTNTYKVVKHISQNVDKVFLRPSAAELRAHKSRRVTSHSFFSQWEETEFKLCPTDLTHEEIVQFFNNLKESYA